MKLFRRGKRIEAPVTAAAQGTGAFFSAIHPPSAKTHMLGTALIAINIYKFKHTPPSRLTGGSAKVASRAVWLTI